MGFSVKPLLVLVGLFLIVVILSSLNLNKVLQLVSNSNPFWFSLAILTTAVIVVIKGLKWRVLLQEKRKKIRLRECIEAFLKGFFLSLLTPGRTGDFARAVFVRAQMGLLFGLATVIVDRLIDIALLLVLALFALATFFWFTQTWIVNPLIIVGIGLAMALAVLYVLRPQQQGFFRKLLLGLAPQKERKKIESHYSELVLEVRGIGRKPKYLLAAIGLGILNWLLSVLVALFIAKGIGIEQPVYFFAIVVPLLALIEIIPISVAGLGTREAGAILLFSTVQLNAETAVTFSLLYFFVGYFLVALLGGLLFLRKPVPA